MVILFFMLYTVSVLPYRVCFIETTDDGWSIFDDVMNGVFIGDLLLSFFFAYYDESNVLVTSNKYIAETYIKGWFFVDLLSVIPFTDILTTNERSATFIILPFSFISLLNLISTAATTGTTNYNSLIRLARLPRLYRLLRLFRLFKIVKQKKDRNQNFLKKINAFFGLTASVKRMFEIMGYSLAFIHLAACFYYLVAKFADYSWVDRYDLNEAEPIDLYLRGLGWSI